MGGPDMSKLCLLSKKFMASIAISYHNYYYIVINSTLSDQIHIKDSNTLYIARLGRSQHTSRVL